MMRLVSPGILVVFVGALAACDPIWGAHATLRDPTNRPVQGATIAVACGEAAWPISGAVGETDREGRARVGGLGASWPPGCDLFVAKPGFRTQRIRYADLCPSGPRGCERVYAFDLVLVPET